eukprot:3751640-Amphidinium_carterae.1
MAEALGCYCDCTKGLRFWAWPAPPFSNAQDTSALLKRAFSKLCEHLLRIGGAFMAHKLELFRVSRATDPRFRGRFSLR